MSGIDLVARGVASRANAILSAAADYPATLALIERLNREGDPFSSYGELAFSSFSPPGGAGVSGPFGVSSPPVGRAVFVKQITIWSTTPISGRAQLGNSAQVAGGGNPVLNDIGFACGPNYSATLHPDQFLRSSNASNCGMFVKRWLDPAVSGTHYVGAGAVGYYCADSINFDAKKVILLLGDSTWNGTGPSRVDTCIPYLINRFYREAGLDTRYILKAYSGSTSAGHDSWRQNGKYDFAQVDAIFVNLGINDVIQDYATAASLANFQALVAWKQKRYPDARLVLFGSTPLQNSAHEEGLATLRAALSSYVSGLGDPSILYCSLGEAFDRNLDSNYAASDGAGGSRIHPADAALTQLWAGGHDGYAGLRAWLEEAIPTI